MSKHQIKTNLEWGSKARKEEDRLRGNNNSDRRLAISEQLDEAIAEALILDVTTDR